MHKAMSAVGIAVAVTAAGASGALAQGAKIGSLSAVTGPIPDLVAKIVEAEQLALGQINGAGGVLGGDLEMVIADSGCDPKIAVDAAQKLVNVDQVSAIVGAICSGGTIAAADSVIVPAGVVAVSPSATAPAITDLEDNDLVYRVAPSDAYQGVALARLADKLGLRSVAMTWANDDYNSGLASVFREAFTGLGGRIVAEAMHQPDKPSYRSELATLGASGAEVLVLFAYYNGSGILIMRQSLENGIFDKFMGADGMVDPSVIQELGADNLAGKAVFTAAAADEESPSYKAFASALTDAGGDPASPYTAQGYDAAFLLALAIEHAGTGDRGAISKSLRAVSSAPGEVVRPGEWAKAKRLLSEGKDINYEGAAGSQDFDANGDVAGSYNRHDVTAAGEFEASPLLD